MANKNQEYTEQYADYAMEQMRRYGIPASVTLAQGILESSNGQSRLAQNENNHFGIKATPEWIAEGGRYSLYSDDKPNEKFCSYDSVGDSYEHHSRFLKENNRYARCFSLSPDDYKGWTLGLEKAGYATGGHYADSLQRIIEQNGLQKYDRQVMQEMEAQGKRFGVEENRSGKPEMQWTIRFRWNGKSFFSSPHRSVCGKTPRTGQNECTQAWTSDVTTAMQCWRRNKAARSSLSETNHSRWNTPVRTAAKYSVPTKTSARYS